MKRLLTALLAAAALLAVLPAALAAEETRLAEMPMESVMVQCELEPGQMGLLSLEDGEWEDDWTCYKDQLTGDALTVYTGIETAFAEDTLVLEQGYWMAQGLITDEFTFVDAPNAALAEWWQEISESALLACEAFVMDHPEYFWIRTAVSAGYSASIRGNTVTATLRAGFLSQPATDTMEERSGFQTQIDGVMDQLLEATVDMTTLGKLMYMDNWLAEQNHYNNAAAENEDYIDADETPWSVVGGLLDGYSPVCEGYAKAFQLFCHEIGVPCLQVADYYHMWTYVKFGGEWYLCDPTWNDPVYVGGGDGDESTREYFMTGRRADHLPNLDFVVPALAGEDLDYSCAGGHDYTAAVTAPTCTENGYTTYTCNICGDSYVGDHVGTPGHQHDAAVTAPTCTEGGYTTHTCTVCGDSYVDGHVGALGHSFTNYEAEEGLLIAHCDNNCGLTEEKIGTPSWRVENGKLKGAEYTTGLVMIALYDGDDRLIAVQFCVRAEEKTVEGMTVYRFAAPVFTEAQLAKADKVLCFNFTERFIPRRNVVGVKKLP